MIKLFARWSDFQLRTKGLIVVAFPAAATIIILCVAYVVGNQASEATLAVNRSFRVGEEIQRLKFSQSESNVHLRGYFLTGEEEFAVKVRESMAMFDATLQKLVALTTNDPTRSGILDQVAALERSRLEKMISTLTRFQLGVLRRDQLPAALGEKEAERLAMEALLNKMEAEDRRLLEARILRVDALRAGLRAVTAICLVLGLIGGVVISILFASGITRRIGKLRRNVALLATGGTLEPLPEGRDEIGELGEGLAKTAEVLRRRTAALESAAYGIAEANAEGRYVDFNRAFSQLTGLISAPEAPRVPQSVHPDDQSLVEEAIARMRESGRVEIEARIVHPGGRVAEVAMTFVPISETRDGGYFVFLLDVSRRKEAEASLVHAKDAAVAANNAKSEFLAKISHDIRTPLNAIHGAADLLSQSPLNHDQAEYVSMFQRNCKRLGALINDFLDFAKIEAGALRVENIPYKLRETLEEAVAPYRDLASRKGVKLSIEIGRDVPERLVGDPLRVHQVLVNLVSNATKFTQQGRIEVRVLRIARTEGERLRFEVSDTGAGISTEDQLRIFAAFSQVGKQDAIARDGCGLGLAICRGLVGRMGGEIEVSSQLGLGTRFQFTLPLVAASAGDPEAQPSSVQAKPGGNGAQSNGIAAQPAARPPAPQKAEGQEHLRVLAAEDTEDNRLLLKHYVRGEPIDLQFAEDGQQALDAICRGEKFDLILMDMDMPVLDGMGAVRAILKWQREQRSPLTPIVALSAHAMREAVRQCMEAGCAEHIAKPVDKAMLLSTIRRHARHSDASNGASAAISAQVAALVPRYLATKPKQIEEARAGLSAKNFETARRFGHNLKGTGLGYGFPRIEEIGAAMERAALSGDVDRVSAELDALSDFLNDENARTPEVLVG